MSQIGYFTDTTAYQVRLDDQTTLVAPGNLEASHPTAISLFSSYLVTTKLMKLWIYQHIPSLTQVSVPAYRNTDTEKDKLYKKINHFSNPNVGLQIMFNGQIFLEERLYNLGEPFNYTIPLDFSISSLAPMEIKLQDTGSGLLQAGDYVNLFLEYEFLITGVMM